VPEVWLLGATRGGPRIAARLGLPFVFAHHFHPHFTEPALQLYHELFEPSQLLAAPRTIVAAGIVGGADDADAARLALPRAIAMLRLRQGRPAPIPSVAEAAAILERLSPGEQATVDEALARPIVGSPQAVHAGLVALAERTGTDELMLTSQVVEPGERLRGIERIAAAFEVAEAPVG
jgi:luciferase family oxidoreductase group 1